VVVTGVSSNQDDLEQVLIFVLHKGTLEDFQEIISVIKTRVNEQYGIEAHYVLPIKKVPKTTSGKVQRSALAEQYLGGEFNDVLHELVPARVGSNIRNEPNNDEIINTIKKICMEALPEKTFGIDDSLLELGASSLALVEIHSGLDEAFPDKIEITDLVDHPTIADLAKFVKSKLH
jgi:acyl carrier protein